jgi:peroxiredoxin
MPTAKTAPALLALLLALAAGVTVWQTQSQLSAPTLPFTTIRGERIEWTALRGHPLLLTFWATTCPGCIEEIPDLIALHQRYHDQGLRIIAVAMAYDPPNQVIAMTEAKQLPYAVALDPQGELSHAYGNVQLTPTTFLINGDGKIVLQQVGVIPLAELQQRISVLLQPASG